MTAKLFLSTSPSPKSMFLFWCFFNELSLVLELPFTSATEERVCRFVGHSSCSESIYLLSHRQLRAHGAPGDDFSEGTCLETPVPSAWWEEAHDACPATGRAALSRSESGTSPS